MFLFFLWCCKNAFLHSHNLPLKAWRFCRNCPKGARVFCMILLHFAMQNGYAKKLTPGNKKHDIFTKKQKPLIFLHITKYSKNNIFQKLVSAVCIVKCNTFCCAKIHFCISKFYIQNKKIIS